MIDWIAAALEVVGVWLVGNHKSIGFLIKTCCSITWIIAGIIHGVHGITASAAVLLVVNTRNYFKWRSEEKTGKKVNGKH